MSDNPPAPETPSTSSPATPPPPADSPPQTKVKTNPSKNRVRLIALGAAVVGMVFGAVVEMFVQGAMESTGWFGPTLESVMNEQVANFDAIQQKLDALNAATNDTERARLRQELDALLQKQKKLTEQTHTELRQSQTEIESLRKEALAEQGSASGADVWLAPGESISVGSRDNVFSLLSTSTLLRANVNISGKSHTLYPGDFVEAPVQGKVWKVFYKQSGRGDDRSQLGFDIVAPE